MSKSIEDVIHTPHCNAVCGTINMHYDGIYEYAINIFSL